MLTEIDNTIKYGKQRSGFGMHATYSVNRWRKIAGKGKDYLLQIRSNTWLMDLRLEKGQRIVLPKGLLKVVAICTDKQQLKTEQ